ncbi:hypothetical protein DFH09DRAFT_1099820 [Mycena vulgaris]|nr:hypothetical protein DFH09DRAFT_1099820 [Mycena vulgaris]
MALLMARQDFLQSAEVISQFCHVTAGNWTKLTVVALSHAVPYYGRNLTKLPYRGRIRTVRVAHSPHRIRAMDDGKPLREVPNDLTKFPGESIQLQSHGIDKIWRGKKSGEWTERRRVRRAGYWRNISEISPLGKGNIQVHRDILRHPETCLLGDSTTTPVNISAELEFPLDCAPMASAAHYGGIWQAATSAAVVEFEDKFRDPIQAGLEHIELRPEIHLLHRLTVTQVNSRSGLMSIADSQCGYVPHEYVAVLFITLFGLSTILHIGQATYLRMWWLFPTVCLCGVRELIGWSARFWSSFSPSLHKTFMIQ